MVLQQNTLLYLKDIKFFRFLKRKKRAHRQILLVDQI